MECQALGGAALLPSSKDTLATPLLRFLPACKSKRWLPLPTSYQLKRILLIAHQSVQSIINQQVACNSWNAAACLI